MHVRENVDADLFTFLCAIHGALSMLIHFAEETTFKIKHWTLEELMVRKAENYKEMRFANFVGMEESIGAKYKRVKGALGKLFSDLSCASRSRGYTD